MAGAGMTEDERDEYSVLKVMTDDTHKFAVPIGLGVLSPEMQRALERLQLREWVRLIDVSFIMDSGMQPGTLFRIFKVMPEALTWFRGQG